MSLDAIGAAHHQDSIVQNLEGALHFRRKIHMSRGIQQGDLQIPQGQDGLF